MNGHQLTLLAGIGVIILAIVNIWFVDTSPAIVDPPVVGAEEAIKQLDLRVPGIASFDAYYGLKSVDDSWRDLNPFVPYHQRMAEVAMRKDKTVALVTNLPPPPKRVKEPTVVMPKLLLPKLGDGSSLKPEILALLAVNEEMTLSVRFKPDGDTHDMQVGDEAEGWLLDEISRGQAIFINADKVVMPVELDVSGVMQLALADVGSTSPLSTGGTGSGGAGSGDSDGGDKVDPRVRAQGEALIKRLEATEQGRRALEMIPGLRERILKNPRSAMSLLRNQR